MTMARRDFNGKLQYATPLAIGMAIHYVCIAEPYSKRNPDHRYSPAVAEITRNWLEVGYLEPASTKQKVEDGLDYVATDALRLYVEALTRVPMPEKQWVIPSSRE